MARMKAAADAAAKPRNKVTLSTVIPAEFSRAVDGYCAEIGVNRSRLVSESVYYKLAAAGVAVDSAWITPRPKRVRTTQKRALQSIVERLQSASTPLDPRELLEFLAAQGLDLAAIAAK